MTEELTGNEDALGATVTSRLRPFLRVHADALAVVQRHVHRAHSNDSGGVLIGWYDEPTDTVSVTAALPTDRPAPAEPAHGDGASGPADPRSGFAITEDGWSMVRHTLAARHPGEGVQGWFVAHPGTGVLLTDEEQAFHAVHFADRRQVAYVVDPVSGQDGFFGWESGALIRYPEWEVWSVVERADDHTEVGAAPKGSVIAGPVARWWAVFERFLRRQPAVGVLIAGLIIGVLAGLLVAPGDGSSGTSPIASSLGVEQRPLRFLPGGPPQASGRSGTLLSWDTALAASRGIRPRVAIEWSGRALGGTVAPDPGSNAPGRYVVAIVPPVDAASGTYTGAIVASVCPSAARSCPDGQRQSARQPFSVRVDSPTADTVPDGFAVPAPSRVQGEGPNRMVPDELMVVLDPGLAPDQADAVAVELARSTSATIAGGDSDGRIYQFRYADPAARERDEAVLRGDRRVSAVAPQYALGGPGRPAGGGSAPWHLTALGNLAPLAPETAPPSLAVVGPGGSLAHPAFARLPAATALAGPPVIGEASHAAGLACSTANPPVGVLSSCDLSSFDIGSAPETSTLTGLYQGMVTAARSRAPVILVAADLDGGGGCGAPEPGPADGRAAAVAAVVQRAVQAGGGAASQRGSSVLWVVPAGDGCFTGTDTVSAQVARLLPDEVLVVGAVDSDNALSATSDVGGHVAIAAPGGVNGDGTGIVGPVPRGRYGDRTGTVDAAGLVAALAADARAAQPSRPSASLHRCLVDGTRQGGRTVTPPKDPGRSVGADALGGLFVITSDVATACAAG